MTTITIAHQHPATCCVAYSSHIPVSFYHINIIVDGVEFRTFTFIAAPHKCRL